MKKSLLTLTLLVGFAPVVFATGEEAKPAETTPWHKRAWTKSKAVAGNVKTHVSNNKKYYVGGTSALAVSGLGFAGYKNPRTVRSIGKSIKRGARRGLSFVKAHNIATGLSVGGLLTAALVYKYQEPVKAFGTKWVVNPTKNVWAKRPAFLWNQSASTEATATEAK